MSDKKRRDEEDYFSKRDAEKKAQLKAHLDTAAQAADRAQAALVHHMKCGKCGGDLATRLFKGVEIDVCPDCGAVLLDPGELEQLAGHETDATVLKTLAGFFTLGTSE
jgi:hypothetical protein